MKLQETKTFWTRYQKKRAQKSLRVNAKRRGSESPTGDTPNCTKPKPWRNPLGFKCAKSFAQRWETVFKQSTIPGCGRGWFATKDIPKGTQLRYVSVKNGTLLRFRNYKELMATGWKLEEAVNYGIGHKSEPKSIFWLSPGTPINHSDPPMASVAYDMSVRGEMKLYTVRDVKAGEELFLNYRTDYPPCAWYDDLCNSKGLIPLTQIPQVIDQMAKSQDSEDRIRKQSSAIDDN